MRYNLSIIIPFYNAEKYLGRCLRSVIDNAKSSTVEYILINDGSTDNSLNICKKYQDLPNVKIKTIKNSGVSVARNSGIKIASGKYIMFVDADDFLLEDWHKIIKEHLCAEYDLMIFSNRYDGCNYKKLDLAKACVGFSETKLNECGLMTPTSKLYRKDFLDKNKLNFCADIINGEDALFNLKAILAARRLTIDCHGFYYYRINLNSATHNFDKQIIKSNQFFEDELCKIVNASEFSEEMMDVVALSRINALYIIAKSLVDTKDDDQLEEKMFCATQKDRKKYIDLLKKHSIFFSKLEYTVVMSILCQKTKLAIILLRLRKNATKIFRNRSTKQKGYIR